MPQKILNLSGNLMAAVMDFGIGMLIAALTAHFFTIPLTWYQLLISGALALLPDVDLIPSVLWHGTLTFDHRQTLFHRPLLIIPLATLVGYWLGGPVWAVITFLAVLWHFIHDTNFFDDTYGVAWLWPFSRHFWSLRGAFPPPTPLPHHEWVQKHWLQPTAVSLRELGVGAMSALVAGKVAAVGETTEVVLLLLFAGIIISIWTLAYYQPLQR